MASKESHKTTTTTTTWSEIINATDTSIKWADIVDPEGEELNSSPKFKMTILSNEVPPTHHLDKTCIKMMQGNKMTAVQDWSSDRKSQYMNNDFILFVVISKDLEVLSGAGRITSSQQQLSGDYLYSVRCFWSNFYISRTMEDEYGSVSYYPKSKKLDESIEQIDPTDTSLGVHSLVYVAEDQFIDHIPNTNDMAKKWPYNLNLEDVLKAKWSRYVFRIINTVKTQEDNLRFEVEPSINEQGDVDFNVKEISDSDNVDPRDSTPPKNMQLYYSYYYGFTTTSSVYTNDPYKGKPIFFSTKECKNFKMPYKYGFEPPLNDEILKCLDEDQDKEEKVFPLLKKGDLICGTVEIGHLGRPIYNSWFHCSKNFYKLWAIITRPRTIETSIGYECRTNEQIEFTNPYNSFFALKNEDKLAWLYNLDYHVERSEFYHTEIYKNIYRNLKTQVATLSRTNSVFDALNWIIPRDTNQNPISIKDVIRPASVVPLYTWLKAQFAEPKKTISHLCPVKVEKEDSAIQIKFDRSPPQLSDDQFLAVPKPIKVTVSNGITTIC